MPLHPSRATPGFTASQKPFRAPVPAPCSEFPGHLVPGLQLSFSAASAFALGAHGSISCSRRLSVVREEGFVLTFHFRVITLELSPLLIPASENLKPEEGRSCLISTSSLQPSSGECHSSGSPGALCTVYHCAPKPSEFLPSGLFSHVLQSLFPVLCVPSKPPHASTLSSASWLLLREKRSQWTGPPLRSGQLLPLLHCPLSLFSFF